MGNMTNLIENHFDAKVIETSTKTFVNEIQIQPLLFFLFIFVLPIYFCSFIPIAHDMQDSIFIFLPAVKCNNPF